MGSAKHSLTVGVSELDSLFISDAHPVFRRRYIFSPFEQFAFSLLFEEGAVEIELKAAADPPGSVFISSQQAAADCRTELEALCAVLGLKADISIVNDDSVEAGAPFTAIADVSNHIKSDFDMMLMLQSSHREITPELLGVLKDIMPRFFTRYNGHDYCLFLNLQHYILEEGSFISCLPLREGPFRLEGIQKVRSAQNDEHMGYLSRYVIGNDVDGPVYIAPGCFVRGFSHLRGPVFVFSDAHLDDVILESSVVGRGCRLGGEVSASLLGEYTNKHHEGFLGHSITGRFVNLGALTTTSDLKNNYSQIRLNTPSGIFDTGQIKLGSLLGDFVRTGIGSMLNTGFVAGAGALAVASDFEDLQGSKYMPPFYFTGAGSEPSRYRLDRFLSDLDTIMGRRGQSVSADLADRITRLHRHSEA